jgi:hypothetical protein
MRTRLEPARSRSRSRSPNDEAEARAALTDVLRMHRGRIQPSNWVRALGRKRKTSAIRASAGSERRARPASNRAYHVALISASSPTSSRRSPGTRRGQLRALRPKIVVPGHGPAGGPELIDAQRHYFMLVTRDRAGDFGRPRRQRRHAVDSRSCWRRPDDPEIRKRSPFAVSVVFLVPRPCGKDLSRAHEPDVRATTGIAARRTVLRRPCANRVVRRPHFQLRRPRASVAGGIARLT